MVSYYMIVFVTTAIFAAIILVVLFLLIMRFKKNKSSTVYPSIVLTSHDSPHFKEKRLWTPPETNMQREKQKSMTKSERKEIRSYWFPKRDIRQFLPPVKGEYLQPCNSKHHDDVIKGRLKFSFGYDYNAELQKSILTVRLLHGRDYSHVIQEDLPAMDTFVRTRLLPSCRQVYTSKLQRRTLNPNYNESYQFEITYSELNSQVLCFEVYRYNCLSNPEIFGEVIMPFRDIGTHGCDVIKEVSMSMNIVDCITNEDGSSVHAKSAQKLSSNNNSEDNDKSDDESKFKLLEDEEDEYDDEEW